MEQRTDGTTQIYSDRFGSLRLWSPAYLIAATEFSGDLTDEFAILIEAHVVRVAAPAGATKLIAVHDWEGMTNYHTSARNRLTQVGVRLLARTEASHIFVRSRVVTLGVQVASLVVRSVVAHSTRESFEAARTRAILQRRATP